MRALIREPDVIAHRLRGLTPDAPVLRGTAQNPHVFFQAREAANRFYHEPHRPRKLLLKGREIKKLLGQTERQGMTLIPLSIYFNDRGIAKMQLGLAHGKRKVDKRATEKERDWKRDQQRLMRERG